MSIPFDDYQQIQNLLIRYTYLIDQGGTEEELLSIFTEDAVLDSEGLRYEGVAGLRELYRVNQESRKSHVGRHCVTNVMIDIDGDRATVKSYFLGTSTLRKPRLHLSYRTTEFLFAGTYDCTARKIDGAWRLERRTVILDIHR